jgi:hypothetical protein
VGGHSHNGNAATQLCHQLRHWSDAEISFFIIALFCPLIYVNPSPLLFPTMGITTHATIAKEKPTSRAITTTAATPKERRTKRLSKSPCSVNANSLLMEINLPVTQFDNVLEAICPSNSPMNNCLDNPCNSASTEKNNQITPHASPTGVDQQTIVADDTTNNTGTEVSSQACVHTSKTTTTAEVETTSIAL